MISIHNYSDDSDTCGDALRNIVSVLRGDGGKHFVDTLAGSIDVDDLRKGRISIHNKTILVPTKYFD